MTLSKLAVSKPTTCLIIFVVLTALGIYSTYKLPIDLYPDMELPYMVVSTTYANAGPEEVERSVTRVIESSVSGVTGLKTLSSTSSQGSSLVMLELNYGTSLDEAANELRDRIDLIKGYLPDEASAPLVIKLDPSLLPIMEITVSGNRTPEELRQYAEDVIQPRLEQVDGIASANIVGGRERAIKIDIPRDRLEAYSLTISQIAQMIGAQNMQSSGGTIAEGDINYTITTSGEYSSLDDIRNTVISYKTTASNGNSMPQVRTILLRDIADVYDGYKEQSSLAYIDGNPCVALSIQKQSGKNAVQTSQKARTQIKEIQKDLPSDIELVETYNTTDYIEVAISQVANSAVQGAILAIIVLFLFLRSLKSTIIIGLTIPISLVITLGIMYFTGFTLNIMTLAGLSLGVGMLVDNSIVILENIYSYRKRGTKPAVAAVLGSQEMIMAITSSTLTTICVFLPLVMYRNQLGMIGQVFDGLTFTVVFSLLCSLIVAIILVPVLASKYLKLENLAGRKLWGPFGLLDRISGKALEGLDNGYAKSIRFVLHHKTITIILIIALLGGSLYMIPKIGFIYMPAESTNSVSVNLEMPQGTRLDVTDGVIQQLELFALQEVSGIKRTSITVGGGNMFGSGGSTNAATLQITLKSYSSRLPGDDSDATTKEKLRKHFSDFPGASFSFASSGMSISGSGIDIAIKSDDLDLARSTAQSIVSILETDGADYVTEPESDQQDGLPQVDIVIDRERMYNLGVNIYSAANEIKANINGLTAGRYRENGTETDIIVGLDPNDCTRLDDLEQIFVNNSMGERIPLSNFASYVESTSPVAINRENQSRIIHVTCTPKSGISLSTVQKNVERVIQENLPHDDNIILEYSGDYEELMDGLEKFAVIILMAVILVFAVMASQFESFLDPFIVLFTIPLSVIGIVAIYLMTNSVFNLITAVGLLILVGIIVNNGIVLVDYTNLLRKRGYSLMEACVASAKSRLRPILMTTLTTVLALVPMAFFPGEGSEMVQPIGQTVLGGLSFGTIMTLFLMPTLYYIFNRAREKREERHNRRMQKKAAKVAELAIAKKTPVDENAGDTVNKGGSN